MIVRLTFRTWWAQGTARRRRAGAVHETLLRDILSAFLKLEPPGNGLPDVRLNVECEVRASPRLMATFLHP